MVNLNPGGPDDGGLIVCKGGHKFSEQFHREMADEPRIPAWTKEWFGFTENGMKWLKDHGLEWEKVCVEPGDLIVWDSRTPHYNVPPTGKNDRLAVYTCYMPVADASQEDLIKKKEAFESMFDPICGTRSGGMVLISHIERLGTTHWPNAQHVAPTNVAMRDGAPCPKAREVPVEEPVLGERAFRLTGIPYIKQEA